MPEMPVNFSLQTWQHCLKIKGLFLKCWHPSYLKVYKIYLYLIFFYNLHSPYGFLSRRESSVTFLVTMSPPPPLLQQSDKSFPNEKIVRDVGKWVESVRELNLALENEKKSAPKVEKVKKIKKKKVVTEKPNTLQKPQEILTPLIPFSLKEEYKNLKLPSGWVAGTSGTNIIFNKLKVTSFHSTYKMIAERGVLVAGDCSVHVFINGSEVPGTNSKKIESIDDVKKAIKDVDSFKICRKPVKKLSSKTKIKPIRKPGA